MTAESFCFWLQGYFELASAGEPGKEPPLTGAQSDVIRRHLSMVFAHDIDPKAGGVAFQGVLNNLHNKPGGDVVRPRC